MKRLIFPRLTATVVAVAVSGAIWMMASHAQTGPSNQILYELMNRMEQLEREIRQLRGDLEVYQYRQKEMERRLRALETTQSPGSAVRPEESAAPEMSPPGITSPIEARAPGRSAETATAQQPAPASQQEAYDVAFGNLRDGQYQKALGSFQAFLEAYPDSALAADAQYWLGETYYVTREFEKAKQAFLNLGTQYPNTEKLPDAMLKLGYIYEILGDEPKARQVLQKLIQTYPNSRAANVAKTLL